MTLAAAAPAAMQEPAPRRYAPNAPDLLAALALAVLAVHLAVIAFNVFGLIAIPLGGLLVFWWRALHLALLAVPMLQALFGRACFLTLWQAMLEQEAGARASQRRSSPASSRA